MCLILRSRVKISKIGNFESKSVSPKFRGGHGEIWKFPEISKYRPSPKMSQMHAQSIFLLWKGQMGSNEVFSSHMSFFTEIGAIWDFDNMCHVRNLPASHISQITSFGKWSISNILLEIDFRTNFSFIDHLWSSRNLQSFWPKKRLKFKKPILTLDLDGC